MQARDLPSDHQQKVLDACHEHGVITRLVDAYLPTLRAMERRNWVQLTEGTVPDGRGGFHTAIVGGAITVDGQTARIRGRQHIDQLTRDTRTTGGGAVTRLADPFAAHHTPDDLPF